jgi:hypothetical protein
VLDGTLATREAHEDKGHGRVCARCALAYPCHKTPPLSAWPVRPIIGLTISKMVMASPALTMLSMKRAIGPTS